MEVHRKIIRPLYWRPSGSISSLAQLKATHGLLASRDVTLTVGSQLGARHPLIVATLADGKVVGDLRLAATRDDIVIGGLQTIYGCPEPEKHYALHRWRIRLPKYRRGTALLLGAANSENYYHWLIESLPRWKMLLAAGWRDYDYVLLHSQPARFQDELLDRLKVPAEKRLRLAKNFVHQFERLVVPAMPAPQWESEPWACQWVSSLFPPPADGPKRVYISRRQSQRRRLTNEVELERELMGLGFVCLQTEHLTVTQQAEAFRHADCVVAPHGAGLTNQIFCPAGLGLVELRQPKNATPCYQNLAAACGHRYASVPGQCRPDARQAAHEQEFQIDIPATLQTIRAILADQTNR